MPSEKDRKYANEALIKGDHSFYARHPAPLELLRKAATTMFLNRESQ